MKKKNFYLYGMILLLSILILSTFLKKSPVDTKIHEIQIGVSVYNQEDTFITNIIQQIEKSAKEKEQHTGYKILVNMVDACNSQAIQNDQVDKFIAGGCDAICVNLVDRTAAATVIDKGKAVDIPIIFFNREPVNADMERWSKVLYVGSSPQEAGLMQGEIVLESYKQDKKSVDRNQDGIIQYVILEGEQGHQDALIRTEYCIKPFLEEKISLQKLGNAIGNWQKAQGEEKMCDWLKKYGDSIEVVFCNNDDMALGALHAVEKAGFTDIVIVGIDGIEEAVNAVKEKKILGTVLNDWKKQGEDILNAAFAFSLGKPYVPEDLEQGHYIRTNHKKISEKSY